MDAKRHLDSVQAESRTREAELLQKVRTLEQKMGSEAKALSDRIMSLEGDLAAKKEEAVGLRSELDAAKSRSAYAQVRSGCKPLHPTPCG